MDEYKSRLEDIMDFLISQGYSVFATGAHKGQVSSPYIVVKPTRANRYLQYSSVIQYYDILIYGRTLTETNKLANEVDKKMEQLRPMIVCTYNRQEAFYDDDVKGYMISMEYRNMKKIDYD